MSENDHELAKILADIENDNIDKSVWVSKRNQVVPDVRIGRDIVQINGRYRSIHIHPVDRLLELKIITQDGHNAAMDIISLHEVALSSLGYAKLKITAEWLGRSIGSEECPMTIYARVMRKLLPWQSARIDRLLFKEVRANDWKWIMHYAQSTQDSFEALKKAIDEVRQIGVECESKRGEASLNFTNPANEN